MPAPDTPSWTDRTSSDPGITILELLAYLADSLSYRQDAIAAEKQRRAVVAAALGGALVGASACWWLCARRASSDR